jgi:uncharacterized protein YbaA (DUF1428 family)
MSRYIDGFVIPIAKDKVETYRAMATQAAGIWKELGALEYVETIGDDLDVTDQTPFPKMAGAGPDETVVLAYIVYRSREHRDNVNAKVMADPRIKAMCDPDNAPFDFKRMAYGGFKAIVEA